MTDEEMMARIRTCHLWISGSRITVSDAASHVASRTKDDYSYDRAAQVLGRMVDSGDARSGLVPRRETVIKAIERTRQRLIEVRSMRAELGHQFNNEEIEEEKRRLRKMEDFLEALNERPA